MTAVQGAARAYKQQAIMTASKEKLVVLLYDGAIRELDRASKLLDDRQKIGRVGECLGKAFSIIAELKASLDHEQGPEICATLEQLYVFVQGSITQANRDRTEEPILQALNILRELKEGWDGILQST